MVLQHPVSIIMQLAGWPSLSIAWCQAGHLNNLLHGFRNVFWCLGFWNTTKQLLTLPLPLSDLTTRHHEVIVDALAHHRVLPSQKHKRQWISYCMKQLISGINKNFNYNSYSVLLIWQWENYIIIILQDSIHVCICVHCSLNNGALPCLALPCLALPLSTSLQPPCTDFFEGFSVPLQ